MALQIQVHDNQKITYDQFMRALEYIDAYGLQDFRGQNEEEWIQSIKVLAQSVAHD